MRHIVKSCTYAGRVRHRRFAPRRHEFSYTLFLMYIDLDEPPGLFDRFWLWSARSVNLAWFRRVDHMGDPKQPLIDAVRDWVEKATGHRPQGPVRLLTHFRYLGYGFNPVSFYYCFEETGVKIEAIVTEVNNTPWGEQHVYVLPARDSQGKGRYLRFKRSKEFHVSPFMPMDIDYDWCFFVPGERLNVHIENYREGSKLFDATLILERLSLTSRNLARVLVGYPPMTAKVIVAIYFEALKLWLTKTPFYPHPEGKEASEQANNA